MSSVQVVRAAGRCPRWVRSGKAQYEHKTSEMAAIADIERTCRNVRVVPDVAVPAASADRPVILRQRPFRCAAARGVSNYSHRVDYGSPRGVS
jgi:hypothetical protein